MENIITISGLRVNTKDKIILDRIDLEVYTNKVNTIVGPSGGGKSTLLRTINRLVDLHPKMNVSGEIIFDGKNIREYDDVALRRQIGLVFQRPNPFPTTVYENVAFGLRLLGNVRKSDMDRKVQEALEEVGLYDEVKDNLKRPANTLSGGQQQRLCIARALVLRPKILMMDEPTSSLDPVSKGRVEDLIKDLREKYTVILVTHDMNQTRKVSDHTSLIYNGKIVASIEGSEFSGIEDEEVRGFLGELAQ